MKKIYLITGGTGHLGTVLISMLLNKNEKIRVLVLPGEEKLLPKEVEYFVGNVADRDSMKSFFNVAGFDEATLFHCAAIITVASKPNANVKKINVTGTENVMELALQNGITRAVYVSSVHAIPELPFPYTITEVDRFDADKVEGQYAKAKAKASNIVLDYATKGLNVSIVHPSGIIGPGDNRRRNHVIRTIKAMAAGGFPISVSGGYDFVDSRDVAEGIIACEKLGKQGECYILNGGYLSIKELMNTVRELSGKKPSTLEVPNNVVKTVAIAFEKIANAFGNYHTFFTPYSISVLKTNANFSHAKATEAFGYNPRDIKEAVKASLEIRHWK